MRAIPPHAGLQGGSKLTSPCPLSAVAHPGRYNQVFEAGECNRADGRPHPIPGGGGGGYTTIDTDKICFSCFRIPTLLAGQTPGVVHAFAEGRRTELSGSFGKWTDLSGAGGCPDGPDTRLYYKRSTDNGATWSPGSVFLEDRATRAENGLCQSQASPVIDPVTKTLFVGFIANGPGCQVRETPPLLASCH